VGKERLQTVTPVVIDLCQMHLVAPMMEKRQYCNVTRFKPVLLLTWRSPDTCRRELFSNHPLTAFLTCKQDFVSSASASLNDAKRFILRFQSVIANAPLQIYCSVLVFAPERSLILRQVDYRHRPTKCLCELDLQREWIRPVAHLLQCRKCNENKVLCIVLLCSCARAGLQEG
jgi:hypothetical protein